MKRALFIIALVFVSLLEYGVQAQTQQAQKKGKAANTNHVHQNQSAPRTSTQEPTGKEKALMAKKLLEEAKEDLVYNCCLEDACDRCALDHQSCQCSKDLRAGKGVCSDCYAGWQMGQGKDIPGITKEKVKPNFQGHKH